jgi:hypothetical protein
MFPAAVEWRGAVGRLRASRRRRGAGGVARGGAGGRGGPARRRGARGRFLAAAVGPQGGEGWPRWWRRASLRAVGRRGGHGVEAGRTWRGCGGGLAARRVASGARARCPQGKEDRHAW